MLSKKIIVHALSKKWEIDTRPVRDERGRFVKGHRPLARRTYLGLSKYPKLLCSTCIKGMACLEYKYDCVCAHKKFFQKFNTRNATDIIDLIRSDMKEVFNYLSKNLNNITDRTKSKLFSELDNMQSHIDQIQKQLDK